MVNRENLDDIVFQTINNTIVAKDYFPEIILSNFRHNSP